MTFENLSLNPKILQALNEAGYTEPTKIQLKAIPKILGGFDIRGSAQTGTGKTAAFLLPALNLLMTPAEKKGKGPRVLILAPTRELAMQIATQADKYSKHLNNVKTVCICGGVPYPPQRRKLSRPYEILIATPGRLIDFMNQGAINFSRTEMLVLDEADRMLDMGFVDPVEQIVAKTPKTRQTLLFSATLKGSVMKLSERLLSKPLEIIVKPDQENHENIQQTIHYVNDLNHKNRLLDHILTKEVINHAIVFTATKRHADQLVGELRDKGHDSAALHGNMSQRQRTRTIRMMRDGKIKILVATDVAARGIDVQSITHVVNFDLPQTAEDYVHRIGRTGRAGASGTALSFVSNRDSSLLKDIEKYTGKRINVVEIEGLEPRPQRATPKKKGPAKKGYPKPCSERSRPKRKKSFKGKSNSKSSYGAKQDSKSPFGAKRKFTPKGKAKKKRANRQKRSRV